LTKYFARNANNVEKGIKQFKTYAFCFKKKLFEKGEDYNLLEMFITL
jgi:hypothetical protein